MRHAGRAHVHKAARAKLLREQPRLLHGGVHGHGKHAREHDPHALQPDQDLVILPINGTYYEWQDGDGLNGVARFFNVSPEDIINYPGNNLDLATIGDYANPNIEPGTMLIIRQYSGHDTFSLNL